MRCPRCHATFENAPRICPECGVQLAHNVSGVVKTSAVLIASGDESGFYRSVQEVPEPLRTQLKETTSGANAGTIVIADQAGRQRLTEAFARREAAAEKQARTPAPEPESTAAPAVHRVNWLKWAALILVILFTAIIGAIFEIR